MPKKLLKLWPIWAPIALATVAFVADLQGVIDFIRSYLLPALKVKVPIAIVLAVATVAGGALYLIGRRIALQIQVPDRTLLLTQGHFFEKMQNFFVSAQRQVTVAGLTKDWVFPLMISVFVARRKGINVDVLCTDGTHERYTLLENLGCNVRRSSSSAPWSGALSDPDEILLCQAITENPRSARDNIYGRIYSGSVDWHSISALRLQLGNSFRAGSLDGKDRRDNFKPELVEADDGILFERLKRVRAYTTAQFERKDVIIEDLRPVATQVVRYKLAQVDHLLRLYEEKGWLFFRTCGIMLRNGEVSLLIPPVLEEHDGDLCVTEGHTRLFRLRQRGEKKVSAVVVRSVVDRLPSPPSRWAAVEVADDRTEKREPQFARYIETTTHKHIWVTN